MHSDQQKSTRRCTCGDQPCTAINEKARAAAHEGISHAQRSTKKHAPLRMRGSIRDEHGDGSRAVRARAAAATRDETGAFELEIIVRELAAGLRVCRGHAGEDIAGAAAAARILRLPARAAEPAAAAATDMLARIGDRRRTRRAEFADRQ